MKISKLELKRQLLHFFYGAIIICLLHFRLIRVRHLILLLGIGLIFSFLSKKYSLPYVTWILKQFSRKKELKHFPGKGVIFFTLGTIIALYLFPFKAALASIAILTTGDSTAHIFGKLLRKKEVQGIKSIRGTCIGILLSAISAMLFINILPAILSSVISLGYENIKNKLDDNILIPIIAGIVIVLV